VQLGRDFKFLSYTFLGRLNHPEFTPFGLTEKTAIAERENITRAPMFIWNGKLFATVVCPEIAEVGFVIF
jgi:hypothetical protein